MAAPTSYSLSYDFTAYQTANPSDPLPADKLEIEFNNLETTTDEIIANLGLIQRSDGELANASVGNDQLKDEVVIGLNPTGDWVTSTAYAVNDVVYESNKVYKCLIAHTSGTFATDLAALKWEELLDFDQFITATESDLTAVEADLSAIEADLAATEGDASTTEADVTAVESDLASMEADLAAITGDTAAVEADLAAVESDLSATEGDSTATAADLLATEADVALTGADVTATEADLAATEGDSTATAADLTATEADLAATEGDATATAADLALVEADLSATEADLTATEADLAATEADVGGLNLPTPVASKYGAILVQNNADDGFDLLTSQGTSGQVLTSNGADALPSFQDAAGGIPCLNNGLRTNAYHVGGFGIASGTFAIAADTLYAIPFYVGKAVTVTRIGINVTTTGAAANARLGIYQLEDGEPTALVLDAGTVSVGTTGEKEATISEALSPGLYMLAVVADGAVTLTGFTPTSTTIYHVMGLDALNDFTEGASRSFTYAALPDPFGTATIAAVQTPAIWLRKV